MKHVTANVSIDLCCITFLIILASYIAVESYRKEKLSQYFFWICITNLGMLIGDLPNWLCEGFEHWWNPAALWLGCLLQFSSGVALPVAYSKYMMAYLEQRVKFNQKVPKIIYCLAGIGTVCVIVNLFNGMLYYIDAENVYHRGDFWIISQIIAVGTIIIDLGMEIYYRKYMRRKVFWAFISYKIMPFFTIILQSVFYGIASTYVGTTVSIFIIYLNIQSEQNYLIEQQQNKLAENRVKIMISQIQPHFLFNTLTGIGDLCHSDSARAEEAIIKFSRFLRGNLDSLTDTGCISFEQELAHTKQYLDLEKMRFGEELHIVYKIESTQFRLPPLTLQPIVENAVRYGASKKEGGGTVTIITTEDDMAYKIKVVDDGPGFDFAKPLEDGRNHVGVANVRERIETQCGGELQFKSQVGVGTEVVITIPK